MGKSDSIIMAYDLTPCLVELWVCKKNNTHKTKKQEKAVDST